MIRRKQIRSVHVNNAIRDAGGAEILVKGEGYWYFMEGEAHKWPRTMVEIHRLNHYTLQQWVEVWREYRDEYLNS